jgi:2-dehydro-3-deoxygluconokinase
MTPLAIKSAEKAGYDLVSLGEVMLRLDPGPERIHCARTFRTWEGGGEYNVARNLRRCFGLRTAVVTALADNAIGRLIEDLILQGGVDTSHIRWVPYDGIGRGARNGLNFTERGFGVRGPVGVSDRGNTAASQMRPGSIDWEHLFGTIGVRWFHTGGVYAALSPTAPEVITGAVAAAKRHGTVVSYDLNYRPSLWANFGGHARATEVSRSMAAQADVLFGNQESFSACLGLRAPGGGDAWTPPGAASFKGIIEEASRQFPNLRVIAATLRFVRTATRNDWGALAWSHGTFAEATQLQELEIFDRVGGGDGFASGLIYGLMETGDLQTAVEYGAAHGALVMTTPGDTSMASCDEVLSLASGGGHRIRR